MRAVLSILLAVVVLTQAAPAKPIRDATIAEITARCGFPNANYLKRLFKRQTGQTMSEWRCRDTP